MKKRMLINVVEPEESRIAILEDGVLEELYIERFSREQIAGNIYKGRIVNVEPSIEAAFVNIGISRNGFLHVSDVKNYRCNGEEQSDSDSAAKTRGNKTRIKTLINPDQEILVQVIKEGIGDKGPKFDNKCQYSWKIPGTDAGIESCRCFTKDY